MPAPVTVDMSALSGPWPGFTLSGITGTGAASLNGNLALDPASGPGGERTFTHVNGLTTVEDTGGGSWEIALSGVGQFASDEPADWPWLVESWTATDAATGAPVFTRWQAPPGTIEQAGAVARVDASLTTALTGTNNDIKFTAKLPGRLGNNISMTYVNPAANNVTLLATVTGRDISIRLATDGSGAITTTANHILTAIDNLPDEDAIVSAALAPGNDGTGVVTAMAKTYCSGGEGGLPLPPQTAPI